MSAPRLLAILRGLRVRAFAIVVAFGAAMALALAAVAARIAGVPTAAVVVALVVLAAVAVGMRIARALDTRHVARALDAAVPTLEDSTDLLLDGSAPATSLEILQRERVRTRLATAAIPDLRARWPIGALALAWTLAALVAVGAWTWPAHEAAVAEAPTPPATAAAATATVLVGTRIDVTPPAYTGLAARTEPALDLSAPEGSRLRWQLRFDPEPDAVALAFHDGHRLDLVHGADGWGGEHVLAASSLYRIEIAGSPALADARLHRLDAIPDREPEIRVLAPEQTLTVLDAHQPAWELVFEASDDHALGEARLTITLAQGSGEQVTVKEQDVVVRPAPGGDARQRRYRHRVELDALGFAAGDDLIVRLRVADKRAPTPNVAQSASFILRWPAEMAAEADGVDGIVQKVLPAYFRSQRQIIIDTEALLAERATLSADAFVQRSDAIGVDQKILRLRYGQFLGEEFESGKAPPPEEAHDHANDRPAFGLAREKAKEHADGHDDAATAEKSSPAALPEGHTHDDGHDHGTPAFGDAGALVAEYGHTHDHAEAATLLDPETKRILKSALDAMWQAELHLRTGEPKAALPFENRALGYIKQVQQASRIYLARVGLELPPVDESRRLSGERKDLREVRNPIGAAERDDAALRDFNAALERGDTPDATAFTAWLRAREVDLPDALAVHAALDAWQRDAACADCRARLLDRLWPLLPAVPPAAHARRAPDAAGDAYLDALRDGAKR